MNVAFVTHDGVLRAPEVRSHAVRLHLAAGAGTGASARRRGVLTGVEVCDIPVDDARAAREMVLLGSSVKVAPIVAVGRSADRRRQAGTGRQSAARRCSKRTCAAAIG